MWKVLIADDEPKIRKGLKNLIDWSGLDMEVVAEAEDGEIAYEMAKETKPDILLVDICMPFLNGLQLIEKLNEMLTESKIIIITGHDEFAYAQQALKLKVFDYILKPVSKEQLYSLVSKAKEELALFRQENKYIAWAKQQLNKNMPFLKERFLNDFINGHLTELEVEEQLKFFGIVFEDKFGMIVIKAVERISISESLKEWDRKLLLFAVQNIVEELLLEHRPNIVFGDNKDNIVAITGIRGMNDWVALGDRIKEAVEKYLKQVLLVSQDLVRGGIFSIPSVYEKLVRETLEKSNCTPIVIMAKKYVEDNYFKEELSLQEVAHEIQISSSYLSRLLKNETGASFIDYVTQVRIKKAVQLMNDPAMKIYEVAEKVGYSSQHYFSTAFKKVLGVSPIEYKKGGIK